MSRTRPYKLSTAIIVVLIFTSGSSCGGHYVMRGQVIFAHQVYLLSTEAHLRSWLTTEVTGQVTLTFTQKRHAFDHIVYFQDSFVFIDVKKVVNTISSDNLNTIGHLLCLTMPLKLMYELRSFGWMWPHNFHKITSNIVIWHEVHFLHFSRRILAFSLPLHDYPFGPTEYTKKPRQTLTNTLYFLYCFSLLLDLWRKCVTFYATVMQSDLCEPMRGWGYFLGLEVGKKEDKEVWVNDWRLMRISRYITGGIRMFYHCYCALFCWHYTRWIFLCIISSLFFL